MNGETGSWFSDAVEPGAVIFHEGQFHMFFNGFSGWPAKAGVGHAVSNDCLTWELVGAGPVLDSGTADFAGYTFFASAVIQRSDSSWAMYLYTLAEGRDGAPGEILMASAPALDGPWSLNGVPILSPGEPGAWDGSRVTQPSVLFVEGQYRMYFAGYENDRLQGGRWIGLATSPDGITWEKEPEPLFTFSDNPRDWDAFRVFQPRVVQLEDGFLMLYKSNVSVGRSEGWGFAFSQDGLEWVRADSNPVITEKTYAIEWRRNGIGDLLYLHGELLLFLEILEREGGGYHHGNAAYASNIFLFKAPVLP